jgi:ribosome-binding factor A
MRPYRKERVGSLIRDIVGETIAHRLSDPRISGFATVTRVEMSGDLLFAKVYISIMGDEVEERKTMTAIQHAAGHIRRRVASEIRLRQCPRLRFLIDESAKVARETLSILEENRRRNPELYADLEDLHRRGDEGVEQKGESENAVQDRDEVTGA